MSEENRTLMESIRNRVDSNPTEHVLNVLKAGLATAPFCGGIASLMSDYIPSSKHARLEEFAATIAHDLSELQHRVDEQKILTDEFAYVFEKCFRGVAENYQKEKLEAFRGILVNTALGLDLPEQEKDHFLNLASTLSTLHITILSFAANPERYLEEKNISSNEMVGGFSNFFPKAIPGVQVDVIKSAFGDLYQLGLINTDKTIFETMTSGQGLALLGNGERVSSLGKRFVQFCASPCA